MRVLITSAGRRTSLVRAFKEAAARRGWEVLAGDIDPLAPALYVADQGVYLPRVASPSYIDELLSIVRTRNVRLVVPTIDTELMPLAEAREGLLDAGCVALVSSPNAVRVFMDKWETVRFFRDHGITTPRSWLPNELKGAELPERLFVKPRKGSASKSTYRVTRENLRAVLPLVEDPIVQEYVPYPEITIDALLDLEGKPIHYVPRRRLKTVGGESVEGVTIPDDEIRPWVVGLLEKIGALGGCGPITAQAFLSPDGPMVSEINPRFGGGFPLALAAGADYPELIMQVVEGRQVQPAIGQYRKNLFMTRYYVELILEQPLWKDPQ